MGEVNLKLFRKSWPHYNGITRKENITFKKYCINNLYKRSTVSNNYCRVKPSLNILLKFTYNINNRYKGGNSMHEEVSNKIQGEIENIRFDGLMAQITL